MIQHIGQDFSKSVKLNLMPGKTFKRGVYQMAIQYVTDVSGVITMHHSFQNMMGGAEQEFEAIIGCDVRHLSINFHCHNSFPTNPLIHVRYDIRVDRLILLNLAWKLLRQRIENKS